MHISDSLNGDSVIEADANLNYQETKTYQPVIQSNLKFAAYGSKFLKNYIHNLSKYIARLNEVQVLLQLLIQP